MAFERKLTNTAGGIRLLMPLPLLDGMGWRQGDIIRIYNCGDHVELWKLEDDKYGSQ